MRATETCRKYAFDDEIRKLSAAGVETRHTMFAGALHGFFTGQVGLQQSIEAATLIAEFIEQTQRKAQP